MRYNVWKIKVRLIKGENSGGAYVARRVGEMLKWCTHSSVRE